MLSWIAENYEDFLTFKKSLYRDANELPYFKSLAHGNYPRYRDISGQKVVNLSAYDYLGLNENSHVRNAAKKSIEKYGISTAASRVVSGQFDIHSALENKIANFTGMESSVSFVSGHATNVTTISHLFGKGHIIICDQYAHNSIELGALSSGARMLRFHHNNLEKLENILRKFEDQKMVVCIEGLYSMDGDIPPIKDIIDLKHKYGFALYVDDSHGLGTMGQTGRGICEEAGINPSEIDVLMGTHSKSLGSCGGFIAGSLELIEYLKFTSPGFIFSTGLPAPLVAAALASLEILDKNPFMVQELRDKSSYLASKLDKTRKTDSPIISIPVDFQHCYEVARTCQENGVRVFPVTYPAVSKNKSRIRLFVSRLHTYEDLDFAAETIQNVLYKI